MQIRQREIEEYLDEIGESPFREWILSLKDIKTRARIRMRVNCLRLGNFGDCRFLGNGVYELKIDLGPGYRIYLERVTSSSYFCAVVTRRTSVRTL